jgi:biotin synthase
MTSLERLTAGEVLSVEEFQQLIDEKESLWWEKVFADARETALAAFGNRIYTRGLIEFSNYCKQDCLYCGIRAGNPKALRYRLMPGEILECCDQGYTLGFRTFVLQGGEDPWYTDEKMASLIRDIKTRHPDCALTLSLGEKTHEAYRLFREAGADRYLLRHETADAAHFASLHPPRQRLETRMACLWDLKALGYQVGTGFMVGSPGQTTRQLAMDMAFIQKLQPQMVGIGPFIPHQNTPFHDQPAGTLEMTLKMIALLRLMLPDALLPSTTALGTIAPDGRERGILAGANVVMPNLSPVAVRKKYSLYDNKICTGEESAQCRQCLSGRMASIGYELTVHRGDFVPGKGRKHVQS